MRPWWDGAHWRLEPPPPGVPTAPLAPDRWPLVVVPRAVTVAMLLAVVQGCLIVVAEGAVLVDVVARTPRLVILVGPLLALGCAVVINAPRLTTLRNRPRATLTLCELILALLQILAVAGIGLPFGVIAPVISITIVALLSSRSVNTAVRAAATPVPYPDAPRLPRVARRRDLAPAAA